MYGPAAETEKKRPLKSCYGVEKYKTECRLTGVLRVKEH